MRYTPDHKARTRARILREAGLLFRRHGYRGVGVERIMAAARLTRGGFYAHFRSKAALFSAVLDQPTDFVARLQAARAAAPQPDTEAACAVIAGYLDPANREKVARGCTLATLTQDVAREGAVAKRAYTRKVLELTHELEQHLPASLPAAAKRERAQAAVILCVGAIAIARSVADETLARQVLQSAEERACAALREDDARRSTP
jgi:AcrR family transcriptional regulator